MAQFIARWEDGITVLWRSLTWLEFKQVTAPRSQKSSLDIYSLVSIDGPSPETVPAGVADYIFRHVLDSPFKGDIKSIEEALVGSRKRANTYMSYARALVCSVLNYRLEDIDSWDSDTFFDRLAMAEVMEARAGRPALNPQPDVKQSKAAKSLWEQERQQGSKKAITQSQAESLRRAKQSRRER